jgi:CheY-like chemotaxis protein
MDAEAAAHCFDPFFTTKGPSKGTGLGLAAVRGVVAECGGAIEVASELGVGTTFTILVPAARTLPELAQETEVLDKQALAGEVTILVAEDDDTLRTLIVKVLAQAGYRIFSAAAGDLALELAAKLTDPIDLLVTDVAMPGMNGPALAAEIERQSPGTLVLFISSNTAGIALPDSGAGTTSFLPKPFRPSQLVSRVRQLLDARTQQVSQEMTT